MTRSLTACGVAAALGLTVSGGAQALSLRAELGYWAYTLDGTLQNGATRDLQDELQPRTRRHDYLRFDLDFGPAWAPELVVSRHRLHVTGGRTVDSSLSLGAITLLPDATRLDAFIDVTDLTATARYRYAPSDTFAALAGLSLRQLRGTAQIRERDGDGIEREPIDERFPQLHLAAQWHPADALAVLLDAGWVEYRDERAWQAKAAVDVAVLHGLGLTAGYQIRHFTVQGSSALDARFQGAHLGLLYRW